MTPDPCGASSATAEASKIEAAVTGSDSPCCVGTPSGYIQPDGTRGLMCDDECDCGECRC